MKTLKPYIPVLFFLTLAAAFSFVVQHSLTLTYLLTTNPNGFYFALTLLFAIGYGIKYFAPKTTVPVFVWAILFGMALQIFFFSLTTSKEPFLIIINLLASLILFTSGLHVPVKNFKKYFAPIATLSTLGTLLTILLFAITLSLFSIIFELYVPTIALLVLAAILASIDPTTVIATLEHLHFRRPFLRDIAIAESAVNDVVGIIFTRFFLLIALSASALTFSIGNSFVSLFTKTAASIFALEVVWGVLVGLLGSWILTTWGGTIRKKHWSDVALFFIVPLFCFTLGSLFGNSGFFAAFIAGLLFETDHKTNEIHLFFDNLVDHFIKPVIFVLLGAITSLSILSETMIMGVFVSIIFMFVIRPFIVYLSLLPWMISKKALLHWKEIIFLSFVRETGAVPAVLLLFVVISGVVGAGHILAIGVWVILYTLVIEPPLTPLLAENLGITEPK